MKPYARNRIDYVVNLIEPRKKLRVLNIGISNIPEIEQRIEDTVECWTIDIDRKKVAGAQSHLKKTKLIVGDLTKNPDLPENYFDVVVVLEVLEHLDDDRALLKLINRVLRKNGSLIVGVPNRSPLHIFNPVMYAEHKRHYSNAGIKQKVTDAGFRIEHFNIVENWTLLASLYVHLFFKFILKRKRAFGVFTEMADSTYRQQNASGMDIILKARKVRDI
ncbi:methyltransferase domain-containing protein [Candidatus Pacearchaeota archaeon]|nr:methyltransferase domain-containing protein [Candidatus Pacearchaeota archaeon]